MAKEDVKAGLFCTAAVAVAMAAATAAWSAEVVPVDKGADITTMCGAKPARVALIDGYGGNTWRRIAVEELRDEASKCKNITEVQYTDARGDAQAYTSAINGYTAQHFDIIIAFADFGDAAIPAYRSATRAGVVVAPYLVEVHGKLGTDFSVNTYEDLFGMGQMWAKWVGQNIKDGNTIFLGGLTGSASSVVFLNGYKDGLKNYPGIKLLDPNYIVTNWSPADSQRAVSGLIAKYPKIDAIVSDWGGSILAAVKAYQQAGLPIPAMAYVTVSNELSCKFIADKAAGHPWGHYALGGTTADVRFALRAALAQFEGTTDPDSRVTGPLVFADSAAGKDPKCDESLPPDADLASSLSPDKLKALLKQ